MPVCPKPNCNGSMFLEDKVLFCGECGYTATRNHQDVPVKPIEFLERKRGRGRPRMSEKRQLGIISLMERWTPGKIVSHKPKGLKSTICISKTGVLHYRTAGHVHKHLKQRAIA